MVIMFMSRIRSLPRFIRCPIRSYWSFDHPASNQIIKEGSLESLVLSKALKHIPTYGFTSKCILNASRELNYSDSVLSVFSSSPSGKSIEFQLVLYWLKSQRQMLRDSIVDRSSKFHTIKEETEKVKYLINQRLEYNAPVKDHLTSAIAQLVTPYNWDLALEELRDLADDIAYYSGDLSNDFAWYTKRAGYSSIYVSSELYMLQDTSKDLSDTKEFVHNKVEGFHELGNAYNDAEEWGLFTSLSLLNLIKSQLSRG